MPSHRQGLPYVPVELVDVILRQEELKLHDLANCCLVNRTWAQPARKWLYRAISVRLVEVFPRLGPPIDNIVEDDYVLDESSVPLFRTLLSNTSLGHLVHSIEIRSQEEGAPSLSPAVVWRLPPEVLTTLCALCPRAKELAIDSSWFTGNCRAAVEPYCVKMESLRLESVTPQAWRKLCRCKLLKTLSASPLSLNAGSRPDPALLLSLTRLSISECDEYTFNIIQSSRWQSLRVLQVPIDIVSQLRPSLFPALYHLEIRGDYPYGPIHSGDFLDDLAKSTSLGIFEMDVEAYNILALEEENMGTSLPPSCRRFNLDQCRSLDALLAVTQRSRSGHRISELGLSVFPSNKRHENPTELESRKESERDFLAAARALLKSINVELIWYK